MNALIVFDTKDNTQDLLDLMNELKSGGITPIVSTSADLEKTINSLSNESVLFYFNPKIRIDMPVGCCTWLNRANGFDAVMAEGKIVSFMPRLVSVSNGQIIVKTPFHDSLVRAREKTPGYLVYTGERVVPNAPIASNNMLEHLKLYDMVLPLVAGKDVLDAACGCGYGTHRIAQTAKSVLGADISEEAVEYSKTHYQKENLSFFVSPVTKLIRNLPGKQFDIITSIETFEHVEEVEDFANNAYALLKDGGVFWFTTPNEDKLPFIPISGVVGYHMKHYKKQEILDICKKFRKIDAREANDIFVVTCEK